MAKGKRLTISLEDNYVSIGDAFELFIADKKLSNCAEPTITSYEFSYNAFVDFELDGDSTVDIDDGNIKIYVQQWIASMQENEMRISTINHYLRDIRAFLYWCMHEERRYITHSFKIELLKGQEELPKIFTEDEVALLAQKPTNTKDFTEWRTWAIVNWVLATGNRAKTICEIKLGDIDFANKEIALRHTKSKKIQTAIMPDELEPILKEYIRKCRKGCGDNEWLFPSITGVQLTVNALCHSFANYCKERGVSRTNIHGLRHFFATSWIRAGGRGEHLQRALGHSTYDMTHKYIQLVDADLKQDYDKYNPLSAMKQKASRKQRVKMQ